MWVQNQRNSWHGVEFPYHSGLDIGEYYKRYAETMLAVDEGLGKLIDLLRAKGWFDSTLIIFMGDNGFSFGEHGLIDKRTAYEESMRVPMVMHCPECSGWQRCLAGSSQHRHSSDRSRNGGSQGARSYGWQELSVSGRAQAGPLARLSAL